MKLGIALSILLTVVILAWQANAGSAKNERTGAAGQRQPVIVELFTSEGCSSCPPADELLTKLDNLQPLGSAQVIALEEHVDYWDGGGWSDPFSSPFWTARQRDYAETLRNGNPYTPQMVVDGTVGFVGSHGAMARDAILRAAGEQKTKVELSEVSAAQSKAATFKVAIEKLVGASPKDESQVILAITESGLHSAVKGGENSGEDLHHSAVVRELKVLGITGKNGQDPFSAEATVKRDPKWNAANLRAVAFVQERKSRHILGATEIRLAQ